MEQQQAEARRQRRDWLLRLCSQSLQRQQVGRGGACMQRTQAGGSWQPGVGWAGQNCPEAMLAPEDEQ
jgi:hypothetical protein